MTTTAQLFMSCRSPTIRLPAKLRLDVRAVRIERIGSEAIHHYATIRVAPGRAGQPIAGMDLLIAAHAVTEKSVVVTNNAHEFLRVPG